MHSDLYAVVVSGDPHGRVAVHLTAARVEHVVVIADLAEAAYKIVIVVIVSISVAGIDKAGAQELTVLIEVSPVAQLGNETVLLACPDSCSSYQLSVCLRVVEVALELVKSVGHLYAVNGEVELTVFFDYLLDAGLKVRHEHLAVGIEVMHTAFNSVIVCADPHSGIAVHLTIACVEQIVIIADLGEALYANVIVEIISFAVDDSKAVAHDKSVFIATVLTGLKRAVLLNGGAIHIAAHVYINLAARCGIDQSAVGLYHAVECLAVFIAVVKLAAIFKEAVAKTGHESRRFVKMIPRYVLYVIGNGMSVAVCNVSVYIDPVCSLFKGDESAEPRLAGNKVLSAVRIGAERAAHELALVVEGIGESSHGTHTGIHRIVGCVEIVEI